MNFVPNGGQLTLFRRTQRDPLMRHWPRAHRTKHLWAVQDQFDGLTELLRGQRRQGNMGPGLAFASKTAPGVKASDMHILFAQPEKFREFLLNAADVLGRIMHDEALAFP